MATQLTKSYRLARGIKNVRMMSSGGLTVVTRDNTAHLPIQTDIGNREVVGYGMHGEEMYYDNFHAPFPAIRFKEDTAEIAMLRKKEKEDWKKLTLEEKKMLYRASFCQTFAEMDAPTGQWKSLLGAVFASVALGLWSFMAVVKFVYEELPSTVTDEEKVKAQVERMIAIRTNPIEGLTSQYDYEKNQWKK